jgi:hypothetical protein
MQLFVVGEVVGLTGLSGVPGASVKWWCVSPQWLHVAGAASGVSQCDSPAEGSSMYVVQHPIDVCLETSGEDPAAVAMPRIEIEVRLLDEYGRSDLGGYAVVHVPAAPGMHEISCRAWRPSGSKADRFAAFFVGGAPQLKDAQLRYGIEEDDGDGEGEHHSQLMRSVGRQRLSSIPGGEVHLRLNVCRKKGTSAALETS